ncbi:MAG: EAL domain-containing protein, partial [Nocardioidaceae bacterium]|nr:EAL domain-containing protein [Nocardioidaceae bacterium]
LHDVRLVVALDGVTGTLAGAAFASWAISPLISYVGSGSLQTTALLVSALVNAVLVSAALGAVGLVTADRRRPFVIMALGVAVFAVADISRIYQVALDRFVLGSWLDTLGALGLALFAYGATTRRDLAENQVPGVGALGVSIVASVLAVVVLAASPSWGVAPVPTTLALLTLTGCAARILLVLWELRELAVIREQALTDELTGVANRRALYRHLDELLSTSAQDSIGPDDGDGRIRPFALAFLDLDHFKEVNDTFGHNAGDALLCAVVTRFSAALDELATPHLLARLGGDEFAVVLHDADSRNATLMAGTALHDSLRKPISLDEAVLHAQVSIGLALAPEHGDNRGDLLSAADRAMYAAKTSGSSVVMHSPAVVRDRRQCLETAEDLFTAIERRELTVEYQPIRTPDRTLVGAEALVRWDHPQRGRVHPDDFLVAAERYRITHAIAEWVLEVALSDLSRWRIAGVPITMSVNISASDLRDESIVALVAQSLLEHHLSPDVLTIEVTESALMHDPERSFAMVRALDELGVNLSVDDYGTGFTSLEHLLDLPLDEIKLARTLVAGVANEARSRAIVAATIDLTHALGLQMVAEGVENEQTLTALRGMGCDLVQGYHVGRPMPATEFIALLARPTSGRHRLPEQAKADQAAATRPQASGTLRP